MPKDSHGTLARGLPNSPCAVLRVAGCRVIGFAAFSHIGTSAPCAVLCVAACRIVGFTTVLHSLELDSALHCVLWLGTGRVLTSLRDADIVERLFLGSHCRGDSIIAGAVSENSRIVGRSKKSVGFRSRGGGPGGHPQGAQLQTLILEYKLPSKGPPRAP